MQNISPAMWGGFDHGQGGPPTTSKRLVSIDGSTYVSLPNFTWNYALEWTWEMTFLMTANSANQNMLWGSEAANNNNWGRITTSDLSFRVDQGPAVSWTGVGAWTVGVEWDLKLDNGGAVGGTNRELYRDGGSLGLKTNSFYGTGSDTNFNLYRRRSTLTPEPIIGYIKDVRFYSGVTLLNHWPIDDDVVNGGEITDIVGGDHGVLILGTGHWEDDL